jgi:hypothetical protein
MQSDLLVDWSRRRNLRQWAARLALVAWLPSVVIPGSYLLGGHLAGLPSGDAATAQALKALQRARGWSMTHFLYGPCGCSLRILEHLMERGPTAELNERVVLVDAPEESATRAEQRGFTVERLTADEVVTRYHIEAAPLFSLLTPDGRLAYLGGYTSRKRGPEPLELVIAKAIARGERVEPIPTLGCAISKDLKRKADPLGIR